MEINSKPTVIDFDSILVPISDENPSGELLSYSGIYDEIREARRADIDAAQGDWQRELKVADFAQVINLAIPVLTSQTKDLQIGVWLAEALTKQHGFVGLRDALRLASELQNRFWETLHPEIDEGDMEGRANAIEWLDKQCTQAAREAAISAGEGVSFLGYEDSKIFDIPENFDSLDSDKQAKLNELKDQAEQENRVTGERWRKAKSASRRQFYEELSLTLEECWASVSELDSSIEANYDRNQMPSLTNLKKSLDPIRDLVKKILQEKRLEEPTEEELNAGIEESAEGMESEGSEASAGTSSGVSGTSGPIKSRQDALKRLSEIAEYFRKTEPHSPVASLVQRSVKWGNMPLDSLLQELVKDQTVLDQIRETLGMAANADQSGSESAEGSSENTW
jgi:type VI secretion system protein ImpA